MRWLIAVALVLGLVAIAGLAFAARDTGSTGSGTDAQTTSDFVLEIGSVSENANVPVVNSAPTTPTASPVISKIESTQWKRIVATGTWRPGCPAGRKQLRSLAVGYVDFSGMEQRGTIIAHRDSVEDLAKIFTELYESRFPIARMEPVENFGGDVLRSLRANNTSAFNCRKLGQINAPVSESPHANGRAIDINPVQNPWRDPRCNCWEPRAKFAKVKEGPGIIRKGALPIRLFKQQGWIWQNIKVPDYMHFDTGYPSRARTGNNPG